MSQLLLDLGDSPKYKQDLHTVVKALQGVVFESDIEVVFGIMPSVTMPWPETFRTKVGQPASEYDIAAKTRRLELDTSVIQQIVEEVNFALPRLKEHNVTMFGYFIYELDGALIRYAKFVK